MFLPQVSEITQLLSLLEDVLVGHFSIRDWFLEAEGANCLVPEARSAPLPANSRDHLRLVAARQGEALHVPRACLHRAPIPRSCHLTSGSGYRGAAPQHTARLRSSCSHKKLVLKINISYVFPTEEKPSTIINFNFHIFPLI